MFKSNKPTAAQVEFYERYKELLDQLPEGINLFSLISLDDGERMAMNVKISGTKGDIALMLLQAAYRTGDISDIVKQVSKKLPDERVN